jgi:hypothetical protein
MRKKSWNLEIEETCKVKVWRNQPTERHHDTVADLCEGNEASGKSDGSVQYLVKLKSST